jgi:hypothetical protein
MVKTMSQKDFQISQPSHKSDKLLRLSEAEEILRAIFNTAPSRPTLIGYIESGKLRGGQNPFNKYYFVYKSSLDEFIEQIRQNTD